MSCCSWRNPVGIAYSSNVGPTSWPGLSSSIFAKFEDFGFAVCFDLDEVHPFGYIQLPLNQIGVGKHGVAALKIKFGISTNVVKVDLWILHHLFVIVLTQNLRHNKTNAIVRIETL